MDKNQVGNDLSWVQRDLISHPVNKVSNSIGTHICIGFGKDIEIVLPNERISIRKEWEIWIGHSKWRLMKDNEVVTAAMDNDIKEKITILMGKKFKTLSINSSFMDLELHFEDGYEIVTFFDQLWDHQWTVFLPNKTTIGSGFEQKENLELAKRTSRQFKIKNRFTQVNMHLPELTLQAIPKKFANMPTLVFDNGIVISMGECAWRLLKDGEYVSGYYDDTYQNDPDKVNCLIGCKLKRFSVSDDRLDMRIELGGYTLETFTVYRDSERWEIYSEQGTLFSPVVKS